MVREQDGPASVYYHSTIGRSLMALLFLGGRERSEETWRLLRDSSFQQSIMSNGNQRSSRSRRETPLLQIGRLPTPGSSPSTWFDRHWRETASFASCPLEIPGFVQSGSSPQAILLQRGVDQHQQPVWPV